mmetsp:Transcript_19205/g.31226  ORF Transcript_19205/g.31226 Transcript_19205/m.31226 type:complete len:233 (+) Transcript_19205:70-768(+)
MNLGIVGAMEEETQSENRDRQKVRVVGSNASEARIAELESRLEVVTKLALSSDHRCRLLTSAVIWTCKLSVDSDWVKTFNAGTTQFETQQKALRNQKKSEDEIRAMIGIPSIFGLNRWFQRVTEMHKDKAYIDSIKAEMTKWTWQYVQEEIPVARVGKMFNMGDKKVEVNCPAVDCGLVKLEQIGTDKFTPAHAWIMIKEEIKKDMSFKLLAGMAPAGDLARKCQAWIDEKK